MMLEERFNGNQIAQAAYNASGVALACMAQCLSMEDYKVYTQREPLCKRIFNRCGFGKHLERTIGNNLMRVFNAHGTFATDIKVKEIVEGK